jgi:hypothetical protein
MAKYSEEQLTAIAEMQDALYEDETYGPQYQKLIAAKFPKAKDKMPQLIAREATEAALGELRTERDAYRKERDADKNARELAERRQRLLTGFRAPDGTIIKVGAEDIPKIERVMIDEGLASHEIAAHWWTSQQRVASPRTYQTRRAEVPGLHGAGGDDFKWLEAGIKGSGQDLDRVTHDRASEIWDDLTHGRNRDKWLAGI